MSCRLCVASASRGFGYLYLHHNLAHLPPLQIAAITQSLAAAMLLPVMLETPNQTLTPGIVGALIALGVIATAGAQLLNYHNIARLGPTTASLSTYLIAIFGVAIAVAVLNEPLTTHTIIGTVVILGSVALAYHRSNDKPRATPQMPGKRWFGQNRTPNTASHVPSARVNASSTSGLLPRTIATELSNDSGQLPPASG